MYAVIKTGGKQYRVTLGEVLRVETLVAEPGQEIVITDVLAIGAGDGIEVGNPMLVGASVKAIVKSSPPPGAPPRKAAAASTTPRPRVIARTTPRLRFRRL